MSKSKTRRTSIQRSPGGILLPDSSVIEPELPIIIPVATTGHNRGALGESGDVLPLIVPKTWGEERHFQNNELYCQKLLIINPNQATSMHFHIEKHETMLVVAGTLYIDIIVNKKRTTKTITAWNSFVIAPGLPHSLRATSTEVRLIESSTPSYDDDSIRIS